ncbi:MAG TPA: hypothetical protein VF834_09240, partial [Streptosporangiaceae bacterium]
MGELRCVDGSLLEVAAVPCHDRAGRPYDVTLRLVRDRQPFAVVGQRCRHQLATLAARVQSAREDPEQVSCWPDPDDRFPSAGFAQSSARPPQAGSDTRRGSHSLPGLAWFQPGEHEYFTLRSRDRGDLPGTGEVRCVLRSTARWHCEPGTRGGPASGYWQLSRRAVLEAWGDSGTGVRAVLTSAELVTFLDTVLREPDGTATAGSSVAAES